MLRLFFMRVFFSEKRGEEKEKDGEGKEGCFCLEL